MTSDFRPCSLSAAPIFVLQLQEAHPGPALAMSD